MHVDLPPDNNNSNMIQCMHTVMNMTLRVLHPNTEPEHDITPPPNVKHYIHILIQIDNSSRLID